MKPKVRPKRPKGASKAPRRAAKTAPRRSIQLRFENLFEEDEWIIAGVRRSRIYQTNLSKNLLKKYQETKELKKELARAKRERSDLVHQYERQERDLENKLRRLETEFSRTAKDFSEAQEVVISLARKFSELMGTDFRADVEEIHLAFQSLSREEKERVNRALCDYVESWSPQQRSHLHVLMDRVRDSEANGSNGL